MADAYIDHGAYASNLGAVPTWGVPQEGDGSATTPAAASSIASVAFASVPTSGTISVCGITISTTGVIGAASVDAAANTLASNINATTTTVAAGVAAGLPQLRNLVFARGPSGGAPAGTCQIMMRVGSSSLNHASNTNVGIATTFSAAPTITQFAGGSGGCWGWFVNTAAIGVSSSIGALSYGLLVNIPMVAGAGFAFGEWDEVHVRTGNSPTISITLGGNFLSQTTKPGYVNLVFDTNTIWTGDPANGVLTLSINGTGSVYSIGFSQGGGTGPKYHTYRCRSKGNYVLAYQTNGHGGGFEMDGQNTAAGYCYSGAKFVETGSGAASTGWQFQSNTVTNYRRGFIGCEFDFTACPRIDLRNPLFRLRQGGLTLIDNVFRWTLTGVGGAALVVPLIATTSSDSCTGDVIVRGNRAIIGQPGELRVLQFLSGGSAGAGFNAAIENNSGMGLVAGSAGLTGTTVQANNAALSLDNLGIGGGAHYEDRRGYYQWVPGQPVLSAVSPDGTVWSWVAFWTNASQIINPAQPWCSPAARLQSRPATGVRTVTIEMLLDSVALANLPAFGYVELSYFDNTGTPRCERTPISFASSSASWANVAAAPYNTWVARKITATTAQQVPLNSMLNVRILVDRALPGGSTAGFAFDPEPGVA